MSTAKATRPVLVTNRVGAVTNVACQVNGTWIEKSGANFGLAKRYLEAELTKLGYRTPSEWTIQDYGVQGAVSETPAPKEISPIDESGLISPKNEIWKSFFTVACHQAKVANPSSKDIGQFRTDVDRILVTLGCRAAFERLPNGAATLTLAGLTDPTVRAPKAGEGERRIIPGLNGFGRDSKGRAYFEEGSRVSATPEETFQEFRAEQVRSTATTVEEVKELLARGVPKQELRREERRLLNKHEHAEKRTKGKSSTEYTKQVYDAGKSLSVMAAEQGKDRVFWYKVGVVAMIRHTKQDPNVAFEKVVTEGLKAAGFNADEFLAGEAMNLIATALAKRAPKVA